MLEGSSLDVNKCYFWVKCKGYRESKFPAFLKDGASKRPKREDLYLPGEREGLVDRGCCYVVRQLQFPNSFIVVSCEVNFHFGEGVIKFLNLQNVANPSSIVLSKWTKMFVLDILPTFSKKPTPLTNYLLAHYISVRCYLLEKLNHGPQPSDKKYKLTLQCTTTMLMSPLPHETATTHQRSAICYKLFAPSPFDLSAVPSLGDVRNLLSA